MTLTITQPDGSEVLRADIGERDPLRVTGKARLTTSQNNS